MKIREIKRMIFSLGVIGLYFFSNTMIHACSSCTVKYTQAKLDAYFGQIVILSLVPLVFGGALGIIIYKVAKKKVTEEES